MYKEPLQLSAVLFVAGMIFQACILAVPGVRKNRVRLAMFPVMTVLLGLMLYGLGGEYSVIVLFPAILFMIGIPVMFPEEVFPVVSRAHLISYTVSFWAAFLAVYLKDGAPSPGYKLPALYAVFSMTVFFSGGLSEGLRSFLRPAAYLWYFIVICFVSLKQFSVHYFGAMFEAPTLPQGISGFADNFMAGMLAGYLLINVGAVAYMILASDNRRRRHAGSHPDPVVKLVSLKFQDNPSLPGSVAFTLAVQAALLLVNHFFSFAPAFWLINGCVLLGPTLISWQMGALSEPLQGNSAARPS